MKPANYLLPLLICCSAPAAADGWERMDLPSPVDDSPGVRLYTQALEPAELSYSRRERPWLAIQCYENTTDVFIAWDTFVSNESVRVTTRIDKLPADKSWWSVSTNYTATFHPRPIAWLRELVGGAEVYAAVVPYGENEVAARFDLAGLAELLPEVAMKCHWSLVAAPAPPPAAAPPELPTAEAERPAAADVIDPPKPLPGPPKAASPLVSDSAAIGR